MKGIFNMIMGVGLTACIAAGAGTTASAGTCGDTSWTLWAGQHIDAGTVTVSNDSDNIYVTYAINTELQPSATFGTLHAWVGSDFSTLHNGGSKRPASGQMPYHSGSDAPFEDENGNVVTFPSSEGETSYTFTIPFSSINISMLPDTCPNLPQLYVVTHAELRDVDDGEGGIGGQTGFGGDQIGSGSAWWYYGKYTICCNVPEEPRPCFTETAFAKGTHIWTTFRKSNPDNLPSLRLTNNRWGWAINLLETGHSEYEIYAGAGLNNTDNGTLVGTLVLDWNGETVDVSYQLIDGFVLQEVHVFARDTAPDTVAPGQFGLPETGYDAGGVQAVTHTLPLVDADGDGGVWVVAHAVVSTAGQCE